MKFKQKSGYMFIGCLFTIAGYILASLGGGDTTHAQKDEQVIEKIVCRQLEVVNAEGVTVAGIYSKGAIEVRNPLGKRVVGIKADVHGKGVIEVSNGAGNEVVGIKADADGKGAIEVRNPLEVRNAKRGVDIFVNENGGVLIVYNAAGDPIAGIVVNKDGDGLIESYKGDWRTKGFE